MEVREFERRGLGKRRGRKVSRYIAQRCVCTFPFSASASSSISARREHIKFAYVTHIKREKEEMMRVFLPLLSISHISQEALFKKSSNGEKEAYAGTHMCVSS